MGRAHACTTSIAATAGLFWSIRAGKFITRATAHIFDGFKEIGRKLSPEIALLPIGAYHPESFRHVHMGPDEAMKAFKELGAKCFVPMHYGTFKLSFEDLDEPPRWLLEIAGGTKI